MWAGIRTQRSTWLKLCFDGWRVTHQIVDFQTSQALLRQQDILCATAAFHFRNLGRQVTVSMRRDDAAFFDHLATQARDLAHPWQTREFWKVIRRSLPKMRTRNQYLPPMQLEHLEEQWHPYFQELEVGSSVTPQQIVNECHFHQCNRPNLQTEYLLSDFPSRAELANAFRNSQPYRATGLDPLPAGLLHRFPVQLADFFWDLFFKIFAWQHEPIQGKGGVLAVIPKKNDHSRASHFRGIMLLPSVYKRLHALLRARVIDVIEPLKPGWTDWRICRTAGTIWFNEFAMLESDCTSAPAEHGSCFCGSGECFPSADP